MTSPSAPRSARPEGPGRSRRRRPSRPRPPITGTPATAAAVAAPRPPRQDQPSTERVPTAATSDPDAGFAELGVPEMLVRALATTGVTAPFPIQRATLPDALSGRDLLGRGRTGSGKTIAFAVPTVARLAADPRRPQPGRPRALVLVPTRELATQVAETFAPLARAASLRVATVFGGVGMRPQIDALRAGVEIIVACPGRLEDLVGQGYAQLDRVEITVLDEADLMADLGFLPGVRRLLDRTPNDGQRLLFSATLDRGVDVIVDRYLDRPLTHSVDPAIAPVVTMTHHVLQTSLADKLAVVRRLAGGHERTLLFTRTKHGAKKLAKQLVASGVPAVELHGNLAQNARQRNLDAFSEGSVKVLVATDIAARGIHVDDVALVVHVDPPAEHKAYLHRSGRTARAGASGVVITISTPDQAADVRTLAKAAAIRPTLTEVAPDHALLADLAGPLAPLVTPPPPTQAPTASARRQPKPAPSTDRRPAARPAGRSAGASSGRPGGASTGRPARAPGGRRRSGR